MKQTSSITQRLTQAQVDAVSAPDYLSQRRTVYRLYTEHKPNLVELVAAYFDGATIIQTVGLWEGQTEIGAVIEVVGVPSDRFRIVTLARRIVRDNGQSSVMVVWTDRTNGPQVLSVDAPSW